MLNLASLDVGGETSLLTLHIARKVMDMYFVMQMSWSKKYISRQTV